MYPCSAHNEFILACYLPSWLANFLATFIKMSDKERATKVFTSLQEDETIVCVVVRQIKTPKSAIFVSNYYENSF